MSLVVKKKVFKNNEALSVVSESGISRTRFSSTQAARNCSPDIVAQFSATMDVREGRK